jgi:paraquat-inducible protein B
MPVEKSYARLGFLILVALVAVLVTAVFFIQRLKSRPSIGMFTYITENVFGLDVSSAVRLKGVPVGHVTAIRVNPHGTSVEIDFEVFLDRLNTIGLDVRRLRTLTDIGGVFPNLRAELMGNPITGEAYLLLDQPQNPPPPMELGFKPDRPYVPWGMPSMFATVQDRLPALLDRADATLQTLTEIVARMPDSLDRSDRFFTNVERIMRESQLPTLSADSRKFFTTTSTQIAQIRSEMDGVIGTEGALVKFSEEAQAAIKAADLPAATQSAREAADNSRLASDDLRRSLPAIRDALEQLRELSRTLEEQPESVVYGPRPPEGKRR